MSPVLLLALALGPTPQDWTALPLPSLCEEAGAPGEPRALEDGRHVVLDTWREPQRERGAAGLPPAMVVQLLDGANRRRGGGLRAWPGVPPLLASGSADDLAWARAVLDGLDEAGERLSIELEAVLLPGPLASDADALPPARADEDPRTRRWRASLRSGESVALGERVRHPFIGTYDVEVASDSGVAAPVVAEALVGQTLHVSATRAAGGGRVHLRGLLDLAELRGWEEFDPGCPDLGLLRAPLIDAAQVAFSGVVESGGHLVVRIQGAALAQPDWTLWLRARCRGDVEEAPAVGWRVADLALLATRGAAAAALVPGAGLEAPAAGALPGSPAPVAPNTISSMVAGARREPARGTGAVAAPMQWTDRLLLVDHADVEGWDRAAEIVAALEAPRLATRTVTVSHGDTHVELPLAEGEAAHVFVGAERTWLTGYHAEIAPDVWMPSPRVEHAFDGLAWNARLAGGRLHERVWCARTTGAGRVERDDALLGAVQLPVRALRSAAGKLGPDAGEHELLPASGEAPALRTRLAPR